ncbi:S-adenosyl-L-methionine-dependent methyltransferase, partial [Jimgerdemannia flammicorona]
CHNSGDVANQTSPSIRQNSDLLGTTCVSFSLHPSLKTKAPDMSAQAEQDPTTSISQILTYLSIKTTSPVPRGFRFVGSRGLVATDDDSYKPSRDTAELNRLQMQHYQARFVFHGNYNAPVEEALTRGIKVLDAGCGPGLWTMEMATAYPDSTFIGTDIAKTFPTKSLPPNLSFMVEDTVGPAGLPFEDGEFDYVYQRGMTGAFSSDQWEKAIIELIRVTKPGGWIELIEYDQNIKSRGPNFARWNDAVIETQRNHKIDCDRAEALPELLNHFSLEEISGDYASWPISWGGRIGNLVGEIYKMLFVTLKPTVMAQLQCTEEEHDKMVELAREELRKYKSWGNLFFVYGRKR